jgi:hypothetical protein
MAITWMVLAISSDNEKGFIPFGRRQPTERDKTAIEAAGFEYLRAVRTTVTATFGGRKL